MLVDSLAGKSALLLVLLGVMLERLSARRLAPSLVPQLGLLVGMSGLPFFLALVRWLAGTMVLLLVM
jgi:hypothetical protein